MKNFVTTFLFVLALATTLTGQAQTIRRVNNSGAAPAGVNIYTTLQAAHDAASANDIIYLEPTSISYGNLVCIRPLTIIGNGYFLGQNPGLQLDNREAWIGDIFFNAGSSGSRITGCVIQSNYLAILTSNIALERNRISVAIYIGYNPQTGVSTTVSNVLLRQNYVTAGITMITSGASTITGVLISNNIITSNITGVAPNIGNVLISSNVIGDLVGNYTGNMLNVDNAVIKNNIMTYSGPNLTFTPRNNAYSNNIGGGSQFGTANGNQQNITPSAIFVGGTASTDGAFQLRTASPALGTGEGGIDVGAFGGATPYRIAGIPNVPTIYQYGQAVSGNTLNATMSTRSNN